MKISNQLSSKDRDFFRLVSQLVFNNPFETERECVAHQIVGRKYKSREVLNKHLGSKVRQKLDSVVFEPRFSWRDFRGEDQELVRIAMLYDVYHNSHVEFDDLINRQISRSSEILDVHFSDRILSLIQQRDFGTEQALRYFEYFYQLRRAWHFIYHGLIGQSQSMTRLKAHLWRSVFKRH
mgnify:FL=1